MRFANRILILFYGLFLCLSANAQLSRNTTFLEPADSLSKVRFWSTAAVGLTAYTGLVIGLNEIWYKQYDRGRFHFFDDVGEWEDIDKVGHAFTAFNESLLTFQLARWTGLERRKSMWLAVGMGSLFQGTIEVMDGFSEKWGFSMADIGLNTLGVGLFAGQELLWQEQRFVLKFSSWPKSYPETQLWSANGQSRTSVRERAEELYGSAYFATLIKDYNAQTYWLSGNIHAFIKNKDTRFPKWLNVAVGYGAGNMFGGFSNEWTLDGHNFQLDPDLFPRHRQYFFSIDIDFTRLKVKNRFVRSLLYVVNMFKIPAPALEYNSLNQFRFHWFYF